MGSMQKDWQEWISKTNPTGGASWKKSYAVLYEGITIIIHSGF